MKKYISAIIILLAINFSFASTEIKDKQVSAPPIPSPSKKALDEAKNAPKELPSLGTCDEYTDYFIYKCKPFKCRLSVGTMPGVTREMETIGYEGDVCVHKYKFMIRNPHFAPTDIKISCNLSEKGRLEMAKEFTDYKKGKVDVYSNPEFTDTLGKECNAY